MQQAAQQALWTVFRTGSTTVDLEKVVPSLMSWSATGSTTILCERATRCCGRKEKPLIFATVTGGARYKAAPKQTARRGDETVQASVVLSSLLWRRGNIVISILIVCPGDRLWSCCSCSGSRSRPLLHHEHNNQVVAAEHASHGLEASLAALSVPRSRAIFWRSCLASVRSVFSISI